MNATDTPLPLRQRDPRQVLSVNTRDDRTEIYRLLHFLHPIRRFRFLQWVCKQAYLPHSAVHPQPAPATHALVEQACRSDDANDRLTTEIFNDIVCHLGWNFHLDLSAVLRRLERYVQETSRGS